LCHSRSIWPAPVRPLVQLCLLCSSVRQHVHMCNWWMYCCWIHVWIQIWCVLASLSGGSIGCKETININSKHRVY
jgi:hypothetical protein